MIKVDENSLQIVKPQDVTDSPTDATRDLLSAAFASVVTPERFDDLLATWDRWSDAVLDDVDAAFSEISPAFEDALKASEQLQDRAGGGDSLSKAPAPTVLLSADGAVLRMNAPAEDLLRQDGAAPEALFAAAGAGGDMQRDARNIYRLGRPGRSFLAFDAPVSPALAAEFPDAARVVVLSLTDWTDALSRELTDTLKLSAAELRVARGLLEGRTAQEISGDLGRSLPTIRSHIKVLLQKTGARRQMELVQFLTVLRQVVDMAPAGASTGAEPSDVTRAALERGAARLSLARYGAGRRVLYLTTSSPPEENQRVRGAFADAGLEVIAPFRPGFGDSAKGEGDASDALVDDWLSDLLQAAGPAPILAGHREGGVLAVRAAARTLRNGAAIAGVALISTGAPVRDVGMFRGKGSVVRRSFLSAQFAPAALNLGYRTAARLFQSGGLGEEKIVRFFLRDNPVDLALLDQPEYFRCVRDMIAYSFQDTPQIVRDIAAWGADWSEDLTMVASAAPVRFIHGDAHDIHGIDAVEALAAQGPNIHLTRLKAAGQLALYDRPADVARAVASLGEPHQP